MQGEVEVPGHFTSKVLGPEPLTRGRGTAARNNQPHAHLLVAIGAHRLLHRGRGAPA